MTRQQLISTIKRKRSLLCVGLDTEAHLVPEHFRAESHPVRAFNEAIVEVTHDLAVAYKLNLAFYEACLLYTSPSPRDRTRSRMPSSA